MIAVLDGADAHHRAAAAYVAGAEALLLSTVNYAEVLVRPAEDDGTFRAAVDAIAALGIRVVPATPAIARDAARFRTFGISLPDAFALGTARAHGAALATFDRRVRRILPRAGIERADTLR